MSVEEKGKDEELVETSSSAEVSQNESAENAQDETLAPDNGSTAEDTAAEAAADVEDSTDEDAGASVDVEADDQDSVAIPMDANAAPPADEGSPSTEAEAVAVVEGAAENAEPDDSAHTEPAKAEEAAPETVAPESESAPAEDAEPDDSAHTEPAKAEEAAPETVAPESESAPAEDAEPDDSAQTEPAKAEEAAPETVAPESESAPAEDAEPDDSAQTEPAKAEEAAPETVAPESESAPAEEEPPKHRRGQVYHGAITKTTPTAVYVDLGDGDQGVVPGRELELMTRKMLESLSVGAEVDVYVVNPRNHRGETVLSINHALEELDWRKAEEYSKSKEVYEALIGGYNKGGLIVRFGRLRGFVPQSQLAEERARGMTGETPEERYGPMVNHPIGVKVMEVDRGRNRLILSERAAMREVRQQRKRELIEELSIGEVRKGTVVSLENFGAFVDIGGAEGLVHVTELAWGHITHPRQAVNIGDEVEVEVISINPEARRIGLSRRRVLHDPWDEIATSLRRGQLVRGRVTKLTKFGAFARLIDNDAVEGLIHISELSAERVSHPREVVKRGDELVLRIVKIDIKDRRLGLSLKSVNSTEYLDLDWEMAIRDSTELPPEPEADDAPAEAETQAEE